MSLALCHASYSICFIIYAPSFVSLSLSLPLISPPHFLDFLCFSVVILNRLFSLFFPLISQVSHSNRSLAPQRCPPPFFFRFNSPYLTISLQHSAHFIQPNLYTYLIARRPFSHYPLIQASSTPVDPSSLALTVKKTFVLNIKAS